MEPRAQYVQAADGVSIAFCTLGEGRPLVYVPSGTFHHIQLEWQIPELRRWYERLAEGRRLIRYDLRGSGLSNRGNADYSLATQVSDLETLVDHVEPGKIALFALYHAGPAAITYAANHPDRVSHLILWQSWARARDRFAGSPQVEAVRLLLHRDWELYTETLSHTLMGWSEGEPARRFAAFLRECTSPEAMQALFLATDEFDVTGLLPAITVPTLILHRRQFPRVSVDIARALASRIPGARLVLLEGTSGWPYLGDTEAVHDAIGEFLEDVPAGHRIRPQLAPPSGTAIILFADIADSTALTERMGDAAFREKARELDTALRAVIRECSGTAIEGKLLGDGVLAVFTSAREAIEAALRCGRAGDEGGLPLHLGIHAGDVIREGDNVYGGAVNIASRISGLSAPGEVLVSETVRSLARTSAGVGFEDRGERALKGVGEPVRVWAVRPFDSPSADATGGSG
jgi:class 3 adenylate cyclase